MSIGDYVVCPFAGLVLAFLTFMAVRHWKGVGIGVVALGIVVAVVNGPPIAWQAVQDYEMNKSCLTAHERRVKAAAAPDDYFGRQPREAAAAEARKCAEFAAKQQAAGK
jgi:hypothetical protein